jgi:DNA topoisomerase I
MPVIHRSGSADRFAYHDAAGKKITDTATLEYIKSLRIPPAYTEVEIHVAMRGGDPCAPVKLAYTGIDTAGRKQYGYTATHKVRAAKEKFGDLIAFGLALPKIRKRIMELLSDPRVTLETNLEVAIALILRIVLLCHFRLGNEKYKQLYKSYGVSTLEVRHLKIIPPTATSRIKVPIARFDFIGKKHVRNCCDITEPDVIAHLTNITAGKGPKDPIFSTVDRIPVKATDINAWLQQFGVDLSSKQFRTFAGSTMLIHMLNAHAHRNKKIELPESLSATERKRAINAALDITSETIHNTRAICKREYCHPDIIDLYLNHPRKFATLFISPSIDPEKLFMNYLLSKAKSTNSAMLSPVDESKSSGGADELSDPNEFWFS